MSFSCSDSFSDLLCDEASSSIISSGGGDYSPEYSSDIDSPQPDAAESIAGLLEAERDLAKISSYHRSVDRPIDASLRSEFVAWILKSIVNRGGALSNCIASMRRRVGGVVVVDCDETVLNFLWRTALKAHFIICGFLTDAWFIVQVQRYYGFQPLTAYLSVNYFDRFVYSHQLPSSWQKMNGWPLQLLSVACLSLAAKMEERLVPSLLDLQVEGAKFIFEPRTIQRMELLVLGVLDWRLRSISPFCYLPFFSLKIDPSGTYTEFLTTRAKQLILSTIQESSFLECRPSCIAAATILFVANDLPNFSLITAQHAESWCDGLHRDEIMSYTIKIKPKKQAKVFPQLQVMYGASITSIDSLPSSSSSFKRKKLINSSWTDDNEGTLIKRAKNQDLHN